MLVSSLTSSYSHEACSRIDLQFDLEDVSLNVDKAIPCGLIITELVSNCLKHAFPGGRSGHICLEMHSLDGKIVLAVRDDGIGLPPDLESRMKQSLGMTLVQSLLIQLKAKMEIKREGGTEIRIEFSP